jgi:hypothetical protein
MKMGNTLSPFRYDRGAPPIDLIAVTAIAGDIALR